MRTRGILLPAKSLTQPFLFVFVFYSLVAFNPWSMTLNKIKSSWYANISQVKNGWTALTAVFFLLMMVCGSDLTTISSPMWAMALLQIKQSKEYPTCWHRHTRPFHSIHGLHMSNHKASRAESKTALPAIFDQFDTKETLIVALNSSCVYWTWWLKSLYDTSKRHWMPSIIQKMNLKYTHQCECYGVTMILKGKQSVNKNALDAHLYLSVCVYLIRFLMNFLSYG